MPEAGVVGRSASHKVRIRGIHRAKARSDITTAAFGLR